MFIYTKNDDVKKTLETQGCEPIMETTAGISVYAVSPTLTFDCDEHEDTWRSNRLDF